MKYRQIMVHTSVVASDLIVDYLAEELGIYGAEVTDGVPLTAAELSQMYVDIPAAQGVDDGKAVVSFYVDDETADKDNILKSIDDELARLSEFMDVGDAFARLGGVTSDDDWRSQWLAMNPPFMLSDTIAVDPTGSLGDDELKTYLSECGISEPDVKVIRIVSSGAFGTGEHETTKLCAAALRDYIQDSPKVLDVGCGSGILSIVAGMLGADTVRGIDIDAVCEDSARANAAASDVDVSRISFGTANLLGDEEVTDIDRDYDIVVANILDVVIEQLVQVIGDYMKPDGTFISSGIRAENADKVRKAYSAAGFDIVREDTMGEWVCIVGRPHNA